MRKIVSETFDQERALYGVDSVYLTDCKFDGEADGESALKESFSAISQTFIHLPSSSLLC